MNCLKRAIVVAVGLSNDACNRAESLQDIRFEDGTQRFLEEDQYMEVGLESINYGMQYLARVNIGTHDAEQTLLLDTGSNQLWVTSVDCVDNGSCDHNYSTTYDLNESVIGKYRGELSKNLGSEEKKIQVLTRDKAFAA